jgi:hypothetical protein
MAVKLQRQTLRTRLILWWGKARRLYLGLFRRGYIRRQIEERQGECRRCGACCQLGMSCAFLKNHQPITECRIHTARPMNCRIFPIDERDLRDRDLLAPDFPCGFSFDGATAPAEETPAQACEDRGAPAAPPAEADEAPAPAAPAPLSQ